MKFKEGLGMRFGECFFEGEFLQWLCEKDICISRADWNVVYYEILEQYYAIYRGWVGAPRSKRRHGLEKI
jgi:hypothetical protein